LLDVVELGSSDNRSDIVAAVETEQVELSRPGSRK
jgi:hypothetical protein